MTNPIELVYGKNPICENAYCWKNDEDEIIPLYKVKLLEITYKHIYEHDNVERIRKMSVSAHDRDVWEKLALTEEELKEVKKEDTISKYIQTNYAQNLLFINYSFLHEVYLSRDEKEKIGRDIEKDISINYKYFKKIVFEYNGKIYTEEKSGTSYEEVTAKKIDGRNGGGYKTKKSKAKKEIRGEKDLFDKIEALPNLKFKF